MLFNGASRATRLAIAAASLTVVVACGGQKNSPSAPSVTPAAQQAPAAAGNATISGTVVGVTGASQFKTQRVGLTVSVTGSSATASVDDSGRFTLTNVPAGHLDLHFMGAGVDAHLSVDVAERATLVIIVRVSGNEAHLEDDRNGASPGTPGGEAEVSGTIAAGSFAGSCAARNLAFLVGTTRVTTNASTMFRDGACGDLKGGSRVEVKGARQADGSILAASVEGEGDDDRNDDDNNEDDRGEAELRGTIAPGSLAGSCASNSLSFTVSSTPVKTNGSTEFKNASCGSLKAGDSVEVKGGRQADGSVLASRVERKK